MISCADGHRKLEVDTRTMTVDRQLILKVQYSTTVLMKANLVTVVMTKMI